MRIPSAGPTVELPRLYREGRYWKADLRKWGGRRVSLRDPAARGWPERGERTSDEATARRWARAYLDYLTGQRIIQQLGPALDAWHEHRRSQVVQTTAAREESTTQHLRAWFGDSSHVARITTERLQSRFDRLARAGYAPSTLRTMRATFSAFFRWARVEPSPTTHLALPAVPESDIHTWTDAEITRLRGVADRLDREHAIGWSVRLLLELALATGARSTELPAIRWSDFDAATRTVRIARQHRRSGVIGPPKSGKPRTTVVLESWWPWHREADGWVLGRLVGFRQIAYWAMRLLDKAGLSGPGRGLHDARRTYGRLFLEAGGWLDELQTSLGHQSIATTEQQYGKFAGEVRAQFAVARMYGEGRIRALH